MRNSSTAKNKDNMTHGFQSQPSFNEIRRLQVPIFEKQGHPVLSNTTSDYHYKLTKPKNEIDELIAKHNEELHAYENQIAKIQIKDGEAVQQNLKYESMGAGKQYRVARIEGEEQKANSVQIQTQFKAQVDELQQKMFSVENIFRTAQLHWLEKQKTFQNDLQNRENIIQNCLKEQKTLISETHSLKYQLQDANRRIKSLEDNIEAEKAAHLESKMNSEVIKLQIHNIERSLEVEKASLVQTVSDLDVIRNQFIKVEAAYNSEKKKAEEFAQKLKQSEHDFCTLGNQLKSDLEQENRMIAKLTAKQNYIEDSSVTMEQELAMKAQPNLEASKKDLGDLHTKCTDQEYQIAVLKMDLKNAQNGWQNEKLKVLECDTEIQKLARAYQNDTEEKFTFLHSLYQRLVAGCGLAKHPQSLLDKFSWMELYTFLEENVDLLISDLNQANEKVSSLEGLCKTKSEVMKDLQKSYEESLKKLSEEIKAQELYWLKHRRDMEEHYTKLLQKVQAKAKKFQSIAEKSQEKNRKSSDNS
ncbi:coiled-coil domain-containing protein 171-like isoform X2 [Xenopus tropicalis]|uniref:Coiled-coil domain-containing protein 171-like isoform X2 n=1 Tax=Xenopus tropicalis TaxID=8364 RepID=A0A8J1ILB7_XENTR|nr:coiled-coil domain-containing protein 171-like isoform X2 [Xenopus tropicalis]